LISGREPVCSKVKMEVERFMWSTSHSRGYNKPPSTLLVGPDRGVVETAERRPKKGGEREGYCQRRSPRINFGTLA